MRVVPDDDIIVQVAAPHLCVLAYAAVAAQHALRHLLQPNAAMYRLKIQKNLRLM